MTVNNNDNDNESMNAIQTSEGTAVRTVQSLGREREWNRGFARAVRETQIARDVQATYAALVEDNGLRAAYGLPTFEPSYELAEAIIRGRARLVV